MTRRGTCPRPGPASVATTFLLSHPRCYTIKTMVRTLACTLASGCLLIACSHRRPDDDRPSILLVVIDTLRADAVSAYGVVSGTTPQVDALAARGVRYTHAYAPAPWTVPSHVSLFTGLGVEHHHIGVSERVTAGRDLVMLATRLHDAGYDTAAFIENSLVGEPFGMNRGFDQFAARTLEQTIADIRRPGSSGFDVIRLVDAWAAARRTARPFFVFVNLFEAHEPYRVRATNPFLPPGTTAAEAARVPQLPKRICDAVPSGDELAILRGLYLGDVAAADTTFGDIYLRVSAAAKGRSFLTVVTSDHGEHLGERRLVDHQYTVADVALHIPLVVTGLTGAAPGVVDTPVMLTDVTASVLRWVGIDAASEIDGRPLPVAPAADAPQREFLSAYSDRRAEDWPLGKLPDSEDTKRAHCGATDRVFGDMAALIQYPYKLIWFARYSAELYNLEQDPGEHSDLAGQQPATVERMRAQVAARVKQSGLFIRSATGSVDERAQEALRALGYGE